MPRRTCKLCYTENFRGLDPAERESTGIGLAQYDAYPYLHTCTSSCGGKMDVSTMCTMCTVIGGRVRLTMTRATPRALQDDWPWRQRGCPLKLLNVDITWLLWYGISAFDGFSRVEESHVRRPFISRISKPPQVFQSLRRPRSGGKRQDSSSLIYDRHQDRAHLRSTVDAVRTIRITVLSVILKPDCVDVCH